MALGKAATVSSKHPSHSGPPSAAVDANVDGNLGRYNSRPDRHTFIYTDPNDPNPGGGWTLGKPTKYTAPSYITVKTAVVSNIYH